MRPILFTVLILVLFSCNAGNEERVVSTVNLDGREIPVIHFNKLPDELKENGISEIIDERVFNSSHYYTTDNKLVFAQQASDLKLKIAEKLAEDDLNPDQRKRLGELDRQIDENSNPVIFIFSLKDKIEF